MIRFEVKIKDSATPRVQAIRNAYARGAHLKVMAESGSMVVKDHLTRLDERRHSGRTKSHFYARAARSTKAEVRGKSALVNVDHEGIGLRRFGGTVRPRVAKYLTIPVAEEAYGRRVAEFGPAVQFIVNRRTGKGVVTLGGRVLFILTKQAKHKADPSVLPTKKEIAERVTDDLSAWTKLTEDRANG